MPSLMRYINVVSRCGAAWRGDKLRDTDIGAPHTSYILAVCRHPGISQEKLAKKIYINKSNVTRKLAYLEAHGYVERRQSEADRRIVEVYPTQKALDILPVVQGIMSEWNGYLTEDFTEEEMEMFMSMLSRIAARAADYSKLSFESEDDAQ